MANEAAKQYFENDYAPVPNVTPELRVANALEYIAYHSGQIDKKLSAIKNAVELLAAKA